MRIRINFIKIILLCFFVSSCSEDTIFFHLKNEKTTNKKNIYEHIVISNPSKNIDSLYSKIIKSKAFRFSYQI